MPWAAAATVAAGVIGANASKKAAQTSADAQREAARVSASASAFRPVGITNRFGTSNFTMGTDEFGTPVVTGAGYTASPEIAALQDRLAALYTSSLGQAEGAQAATAPLGGAAQGLFNLGQQYLATSPEQAAQDYYNQQQAMLAPTRQQEEQRLASSVFGRGRAGLNISGVGSPELAALANARRQQDLQLGAAAEQAAQQRIGFGAGLFGQGAGQLQSMYGLQSTALSPFQTQFGTVQSLEQAAQDPFALGMAIGGRNVNTTGANALLQGGMGAAQTGLQGSLASTQMLQNALTKTAGMFTPQTQMYTPTYGGAARPISANTASNLNYWSGFGSSPNELYNTTFNAGEF